MRSRRRSLGLIVLAVLFPRASLAGQVSVSIPAGDGTIDADLYGFGDRGVVLAHGGRYTKATWKPQAETLAAAGFRVLAFDFRASVRARAGGDSACLYDEACLAKDVLAAVRFLRDSGATSVSVVGGSLGGGAAAQASMEADAGEIEHLVLLAHAPVAAPERMKGQKLFIVTRDDLGSGDVPRLSAIRDQFERAPEPKRLIVLEGSAHAQAMFESRDGERIMREIIEFLTGSERRGLAEHLGKVDFNVACSKPASVEFDRAVALLHHMTYPRAREAFERVAELDPRCAMAHWGIAMTLFQPLWPTRPGPADLELGWMAVEKASSLATADRRETLLIEAVAAFFRDPASKDYWLRLRRWEAAMRSAFAAFPTDDDVAALYALAHLAVAPSDSVSSPHAARAAAPLLAILERNPAHPGAQHYLVHANDAPGRERESPTVIRRYAETAPRNPHALHMPTHIHTRLGDWDAVVRGNLLAAEAALATPAGDSGQFVWDEFPHAVEYLVYAYLQAGADGEAGEQVSRLARTARLQPTFKTAFHLASTRARHVLERGAWLEATTLVPREPAWIDWDRFPWPEAVAWFARGLGSARAGRPEAAREAAARLGVLETAASRSGETLFARQIGILRLEVVAWLAHLEGQGEAAVAVMRQAAELEAASPKHAVTPGPTLPGHELLGDLLLEQQKPAEALLAYRRALELYPRRFNGLLGAARAARASGEGCAAHGYYMALRDVAADHASRAGAGEARAFIASTGASCD